jgi:hypothetical protein
LRLTQPRTNNRFSTLVLRPVSPAVKLAPKKWPRRVVAPLDADQRTPSLSRATSVADANISTRLRGKQGVKLCGDRRQRGAAPEVTTGEAWDTLRITDLTEVRRRDEQC